MIRIVNLKDYVPREGELLIKVDRSTCMGNPFIMSNKSSSQRDYVCDMYQYEYFNKITDKNMSDEDVDNYLGKHINRNAFMNYLRIIYTKAKTQDVALGCWCYPKRCHAETIKNFIEEHLK